MSWVNSLFWIGRIVENYEQILAENIQFCSGSFSFNDGIPVVTKIKIFHFTSNIKCSIIHPN